MTIKEEKNSVKRKLYNTINPSLIETITILNKKDKIKQIGEVNKGQAQETKFWIEGYGCSASYSDMEMICGQLQQKGFKLVDNPDDSNLNVIVTCSVKDVTEHKMVSRINNLTNTNKPLIIAGCLPSANKQLVEKISPNASLMGPNSIDKTVEIANSALNGQKTVLFKKSDIEKINLPKYKINPVVSIIQISTGCLSECSFCQTKIAKGNLQSYRIGDIVRQIRTDIINGSKEIWLSSTDNGCYGLDIGTNLVNLLYECNEIDYDYKIRIGMMNPMYLTKKMVKALIKFYVDSNKVYKFIHIPVQSGSDRILRKMKRGHTVKTFKAIINQFREKVHDITIATDIITGFPTETDRDFELTLDLLKETEPDVVNSSKYSSRPFTEATKLKKIDSGKVVERSEKLHTLIKDISKKRNSRWVNWEGEIVINEISDGFLKGRNNYYKSIILESRQNDLEINVVKPKVVDSTLSTLYQENTNQVKNIAARYNPYIHRSTYVNNSDLLGKVVKVKVIGYSNHLLRGILL